MAEQSKKIEGTAHSERTQIERYFEVILYYVLFFAIVMSYLPMGVLMNHTILNIMVVIGLFVGVVGYRFLPLDKSTGVFRYTFEQKSFFLGVADVFFTSVAIAASGGPYSPFYIVYLFPILSASLLLRPRYLYLEMGIFLVSYYGAFMIFGSGPLNFRFVSLSILILMTYLLALILINERMKRAAELEINQSKLANLNIKLEGKVLESQSRAKYLEDVKNATLNILEDLEREKNNAIQESHNAVKFQKAAESSNDALIILSADGVIQYVNPSWTRITEYTAAESLDKKVDFIYSPKAKPSAIGELAAAIKSGRSFVTEEIPHVRKDGSEFDSRVNLYPIMDESGKPIYFVQNLQDITERKALEKQKSEFISVASHQLRTPLTAMNWFLEMLITGEIGPVNEKQADYLKQVFESSKRLAILVNDLLNVSRLEAGRMSFTYKEFDLNKLLDDVLKETKPLADLKGIHFKIIKPDLLPSLNSDPIKTHQVLANLLSNAVKYTSGKGQITITISLGGEGFKVSVADQGVGIPKSQQVNIFTKFFRADNVVKLLTEGTGLGLYITKLIVEGMGGKISFVSQENKGTTFILTLPLIPPPPPLPPHDPSLANKVS